MILLIYGEVRAKTQTLDPCQVHFSMMRLICAGLEDSQILMLPAIPLPTVLKGNICTEKCPGD